MGLTETKKILTQAKLANLSAYAEAMEGRAKQPRPIPHRDLSYVYALLPWSAQITENVFCMLHEWSASANSVLTVVLIYPLCCDIN